MTAPSVVTTRFAALAKAHSTNTANSAAFLMLEDALSGATLPQIEVALMAQMHSTPAARERFHAMFQRLERVADRGITG